MDRVASLGLVVLLAGARCSIDSPSTQCNPDSNGVSGGTQVIDLTVSDTAFSVGAADSGPPEPNITVENAATLTLTLTNVGTRPHDFVVQCQSVPDVPKGCPAQVCFPPDADIPSLQPGQSATTTFVTPSHEGTYPFISDVPGDSERNDDGGLGGLVGEFVLM
jgi:hypothetical protein